MSTQPQTDRSTRYRNLAYSGKWGRYAGRLTDEQYQEQFEARFWSYVDKNGPTVRPELGPCWLWTGSKSYRSDGLAYGQLGLDRWPNGSKPRPIRAHVASFLISQGRLPAEGKQVCHRCDECLCVNPEHLWEGTQRENTRDAWKKGRMARVGVYQKPKPEKALRVRLTKRQGGLLRRARERKGFSIYDAAFAAGLDFTHVSMLEHAKRTITAVQLHALLCFLSIDETTLNLKPKQTYLFGKAQELQTRVGKIEPPALVKPKHLFQVKRDPLRPARKVGRKHWKFWEHLPEPYLALYRADALRESLKGTGLKLKQIMEGAGLATYEAIHSVLNGDERNRETVLRVANFVNLSESDIYEQAKAAWLIFIPC